MSNICAGISNFFINQVLWGISCGVPGVEASDGCIELKTATQEGYSCTCNSSWCNNIDNGKAMISRAASGITGSGITCHTCTGEGGLCTDANDEGSLVDCGEGVETCLVAKSKCSVSKN